MEGKSLIMSALLLSLVLGQIQAEAAITCCPTPTETSIYLTCIIAGGSSDLCASVAGCKNMDGDECPNGWDKNILENTGGNAVNEYCKLGCSSSVCGAITGLQKSDASEVVNGAVAKCSQACSAFCTKASVAAVETA